jgi:hypothetical protein
MKLIINYDPLGKAVSDGKVYSYVKNLAVIAETCEKPMKITVGSSMVIEEIRALIFEGELSHEDIIFKFKEEELLIDRFGTPTHWPVGFCDIYGKTLRRLIRNRGKK